MLGLYTGGYESFRRSPQSVSWPPAKLANVLFLLVVLRYALVSIQSDHPHTLNMAVESRFKSAVLAIFTVFGSGSTEKAVGFSASGLGNFKSTRLGPQPTQEHGVGGA